MASQLANCVRIHILDAYIISVKKSTLCIQAKMCATNGGATARSLDNRGKRMPSDSDYRHGRLRGGGTLLSDSDYRHGRPRGRGAKGHLPPRSGFFSDVLYIRELKVYVYFTSYI